MNFSQLNFNSTMLSNTSSKLLGSTMNVNALAAKSMYIQNYDSSPKTRKKTKEGTTSRRNLLMTSSKSNKFVLKPDESTKKLKDYFSGDINFTKVNLVVKQEINPSYNNVDEIWAVNLKHCHPRPKKLEEIIERVRTPWEYKISIWYRQFNYEYEGEAEESFYTAFEHDFSRCNFQKDFKGDNSKELDEFKVYLWSYYKEV